MQNSGESFLALLLAIKIDGRAPAFGGNPRPRRARAPWRHGGRLCRRSILRNRPGSVGSVADITASAPLRMILHPRRVRPAAGCPHTPEVAERRHAGNDLAVLQGS